MRDFAKVVRVGTMDRASLYYKIEYKEGRLSVTGVHGPLPSGNARACGQLQDYITEVEKFAPGWDKRKARKFQTMAKEWHLNDKQAGTPAQTAELRKHIFPGYPVSHYEWAKDTLAKAGLQPDNGYSYGSAWLKVEVPEEVLDFLKALPDTDKQPAWI